MIATDEIIRAYLVNLADSEYFLCLYPPFLETDDSFLQIIVRHAHATHAASPHIAAKIIPQPSMRPISPSSQ